MDAAFVLRSALLLGVFAAGPVACGSDPLETDGNDGRGAMPKLPVRDYADSACYGQTSTTLVYDGETHQQVNVSATCRGEGETTLVYVAEELFGTRVSQTAVNGFLHRFEVEGLPGSFRPGLGVFPTNERVFGEFDASRLPGGKLAIFMIDSRGAGEGYLCGWCQNPELHLDATLLAPMDGDAALSIAAHESFHVIHRSYDANETSWVDESLAQAAMSVNGFFTDLAWFDDFLRNPNRNWGPEATGIAAFHYGAGLAFGTHLWEEGGPELMRAITAEPLDGWAGLNAALETIGDARTAFDLLKETAVALYMDDPERGYGFSSFELERPIARQELGLNRTVSGRQEPYGFTYLVPAASVTRVRLDGVSALSAQLVSETDPVRIQRVELGVELEVGPEPAVLILTSTQRVEYSATAR